MNIVDYINEFERLNNQIKHFDMEVSTGVLAYKVSKKMQIYQMKSRD